MEISLSADNEKFIKKQIAKGIYSTINEAINAAINIAIEKTTISQERIDELNKDIEIGRKAYRNGEFRNGHEVMEEIKQRFLK